MIRTVFTEHESNMSVERQMPYPVQVGDQLILDESGFKWDVVESIWNIDPILVDTQGASIVTLEVRIK